MNKRILALLLALVMAVGALPTGVGAINTEDSSPATYETDESGKFSWNISYDEVKGNKLPKAAKPDTGGWFSFNLLWTKDVEVSRVKLYIFSPDGSTDKFDSEDSYQDDIVGSYYHFDVDFYEIGKYSYYWEVTYKNGTTQKLGKTNTTVTKGGHLVEGYIICDCEDSYLGNDKVGNYEGCSWRYSDKKRMVWLAMDSADEGSIKFQSNNKKIKVNRNGDVTIPKKYVGAAIITATIPETDNYKKYVEKIYIFAHPKKAAIKKATSSKKSQLKVTWGKVPSCDGCYVWYAVKGSKKWKRVTVNKKATSAVVKGLKSRKYYKIYVSSYKKYGKTHYWSSSKTKTIKVK